MDYFRNAAEQNWQLAEADWNVVLQSGQYEATARRYLGLIQSARAGNSKPLAAKAVENAQLACDLTLGKDWSAEITVAIALYSAGKQEKALERLTLPPT